MKAIIIKKDHQNYGHTFQIRGLSFMACEIKLPGRPWGVIRLSSILIVNLKEELLKVSKMDELGFVYCGRDYKDRLTFDKLISYSEMHNINLQDL